MIRYLGLNSPLSFPFHLDPGVQWQRRARWVQDGKFLTASGITAGIDAGLAFLSSTYVAPEDRHAVLTGQEASFSGDEMVIPGFNKEKALKQAHAVALGLEYRWHPDPADDPFADLHGTNETK